MRKSRKIILLIICVIFLVIGSYGYMVYSSKADLGEAYLQLSKESNGTKMTTIDCKESSYLLVIKPQFVAYNVKDIGIAWHTGDNNSIEDNRDLSGFVENKDGKLVLEVYKSYDLIDTITINSGDKLSKTILLKKGTTYTIKCKCECEGVLIYDSVQYKL